MAHKGKVYPVRQDWRLYSGEAASLAGYPPDRILFRTEFWAGTHTPKPAVNTWFECLPQTFAFGDFEVWWRSSDIGPGFDDVRVGVIIKIGSDGLTRCRYLVWVNFVDQIPWGWRDQMSHFAWHPGDVKLISTLPAPGGSLYPVGNVEVKAKPWP